MFSLRLVHNESKKRSSFDFFQRINAALWNEMMRVSIFFYEMFLAITFNSLQLESYSLKTKINVLELQDPCECSGDFNGFNILETKIVN